MLMQQLLVKLTCIPVLLFVLLLLVPGISRGQSVSPSPVSSSDRGWVSLTSDPVGAAVYVDNQPMMGQDGKQLATPCTFYIDSGNHTVKLSLDGYVDKVGVIDIQANTEHQPVFMSLDKPVVPPIITLIVAIVILLFIILVPIGVIAVIIVGYILVKRKNK